ncbi:hypothetical protein ACROYT_G023292 [Oculina patagonica]
MCRLLVSFAEFEAIPGRQRLRITSLNGVGMASNSAQDTSTYHAPCMEYLWVAVLTVLTFVACVSSRQVTLVNTAANPSKWHWEVKSGWSRETIPSIRYRACDDYDLTSSDPQPNHWLISNPQIAVSEANRINITVEYRITSCSGSGLPHNGGYYCNNTFYLYLNQSDQFIKETSRFPDPLNNPAAYEKVVEITQPINSRTSITINNLVKRKHVILGFRNTGACTILYSVKVTYNVCPDETLSNNLVSLPRTVAPANDSESVRVQGNCDKDAVQAAGNLYVHCQSNGEWNTSGLEGRCICKENMQNVGGKCQVCPDRMYNDQNGLNCTVLPSTPRKVNAAFVNQSAVEIRWLPPLVTGDTSHVLYGINCRKLCNINDEKKCVEESCGSGVNYIPNKEGLIMTQVIVTNLSSFMNYTFKVYAMNRVSEVAKRKHGVEGNFTTITIRTTGTIPGKPEVSVKQTKDTVLVSWDLKQRNGIIKRYHVKYIRQDDSSDTKTLTTKEMEQLFKDLKAGKTYEFQVFAENNFGKGPAGVKTFTLLNGLITSKFANP